MKTLILISAFCLIPFVNGFCAITSSMEIPGGSTGAVQFNDNKDFGGESEFTYDKNTNRLSVSTISASAFIGSTVTVNKLFVNGIEITQDGGIGGGGGGGFVATPDSTTYTSISTININSSEISYAVTGGTLSLGLGASPKQRADSVAISTSALNLSTQNISTRLDSIAVSTGNLLSIVILSTQNITNRQDQVAISTGLIYQLFTAISPSSGNIVTASMTVYGTITSTSAMNVGVTSTSILFVHGATVNIRGNQYIWQSTSPETTGILKYDNGKIFVGLDGGGSAGSSLFDGNSFSGGIATSNLNMNSYWIVNVGSMNVFGTITSTSGFVGDGSKLTGIVASGGGSSSLGVFQDEVQITSPTAQINFKGSGFTLSQNGSTATLKIINDSTVIICSSDTPDGYDGCDYVCSGSSANITINSALNSLPAGGGKVFIKTGNYMLSSTILIPSSVTFEMANGAKFYTYSNSNPNAFKLNNRTVKSWITNSDHTNGNVNIQIIGGGRITGENTVHVDTNSWAAVWLHKSSDCLVEGIKVDNILNNITANGGSNGTERFYGIFLSETYNSVVRRVYVHDVGDDLIHLGRGVYGNTVEGCFLERSVFGHGVQVESAEFLVWGGSVPAINNSIINNTIRSGIINSENEGAIVSHTSSGTIISGNKIMGAGHGIVFNGETQNSIISNNLIDNCSYYAIYIVPTILDYTGINGNSIVNNTITMSTQAITGIYLRSKGQNVHVDTPIKGINVTGNRIFGQKMNYQSGIVLSGEGSNIDDAVINDNYILNVGSCGVFVKTSSATSVINNYLISGNIIKEAGIGINISTQSGVIVGGLITGNIISSKRNMGIYPSIASQGIRVESATNTHISNNRVTVSGVGLRELFANGNNRWFWNDTTGSGGPEPLISGSLSNWSVAIGSVVSVNNYFGVGTLNPLRPLAVHSSSLPPIRAHRISSALTTASAPLEVVHESNGDAIDGFGSFINFMIADTASPVSGIASVGASRSGNDTSGAFIVNTVNTGVSSEKMRITPSGNVGINTNSPAYMLNVVGDVGVSSVSVFGTITSTSGLVVHTASAAYFFGNGAGITGITATSIQSLPFIEGATNYAGYRSTFTFQQPQTFLSSVSMNSTLNVSSITINGTITSTSSFLGQVFQSTLSVGIPIANPSAGTYLFKKALFGMNLTRIACIVDPADSGENTVLNLQECDGNGDSCIDTTAADITCGNTNTEAGAISNAFVDAGDWLAMKITSVSGTVSQAIVTLGYSEVKP